MEFPQPNMNGTSRDQLIQQYTGAVAALNIAIEMLYQANPHGRDYPNPPCTYAVAAQEHVNRVKALCNVRDEMQLIAEYIGGSSGGR